MSNVLGVLTVDLVANTSSFSTNMDKMASLSAKTSSQIKRSLETIAVAGAAMATAVVGSLAGIVTKSVEAVESMGRLAAASGSTVEGFSLLSYAAKRTGTDSQTLAAGLEKVSKAAFGAQNGNKELSNVFARLGISTVDANGHLRDSSDIFQQVAVKFAGMADGAGKTALAMLMFGKGGAALIPTLNDVGAHIAEITAQAKRYGLVITGETAAKTREFTDRITELKGAVTGFGLQLEASLLPALNNLSQNLLDLTGSANLPDLEKAFGAKVSGAINKVSDGLKWVRANTEGIKLALEGLVALKLTSIAIPLIDQLVKGGAGNIGTAIDKITMGLMNMGKVLPVLSSVTTAIKFQGEFIALLATEEGVAAAASYALGAGLAAIGGPVTLVIAAVVALGVVLYKFRDSTFSLNKTTYELRDTWNAAFIFMGKGVTNLVDIFKHMGLGIKAYWTELVDWFGRLSFVAPIEKMFNAAINTMVSLFGKLKGMLGSLVPQWVTDSIDALKNSKLAGAFTDSLNQAKKEREAADEKASTETFKHDDPKPAGDTSGLAAQPDKTTRDKEIVVDAITKLKEEQAAATSLFGAYDKGADAIENVNEENKASAIITDLNIKLSDKYQEYLSLEKDKKAQAALFEKMTAEEKVGYMTADHEATIRATVATTMQTAASNAFGTTLVDQIRTTGLATAQTVALGDATLKGTEAVRQATIDNMMLGLASGKTGEQFVVLLQNWYKIRAAAEGSANATLTKSFVDQTKSVNEEITTQRLLIPALLAGADAIEKADLATKLRTIDTELGTNADKDAIAAAQKAKDALIALAAANHGVTIAGEAGGDVAKYNYQAQLDHLKEVTAEYQKQIGKGADVLANALALRDANIETLKVQIAQNDALGKSHNIQQNQLNGLQAKQTLQGWNQIGSADIGADIQKALTALPQEIGNTVASAVFDHKKGDSVGKQLGDVFKNLGKNLFGDVAGKLIEKLAAEIAVHVFGIQIQATATTALAANTAAIIANTAAQAVSGAGGAAGGVAGAVGGVAGAAGSAASGGIIGPVIGGVISGVISAAATLFGDFKIVKAINGTTSAVVALGGRLGGNPSLTTSTASGATTATTTTQPSSGVPVFGGVLQSLFGFGGGSGSKPIPVSIESINPMAPFKGLLSIFGFASGGRPVAGAPYLVGEHGPELRVDDGPGSIIPNHEVAGYLNSNSRHGSQSYTGGNHTFNISGVNDPQEMSRQIARFLKQTTPKFSPFSH